VVVASAMTKEERRIYNRIWMSKRRAEFFAGKSCARCGRTDRLELDHVDPTTKTHHAIWSWSKPRRLAELAKCQALCHWCHKRKSSEDAKRISLENMPPHGTRSRYDHVHDPCR
jgi:hypothetical protein